MSLATRFQLKTGICAEEKLCPLFCRVEREIIHLLQLPGKLFQSLQLVVRAVPCCGLALNHRTCLGHARRIQPRPLCSGAGSWLCPHKQGAGPGVSSCSPFQLVLEPWPFTPLWQWSQGWSLPATTRKFYCKVQCCSQHNSLP